ncbi:dTDP-4-dehydrorhamnose 3,5-epimerase [Pontibacter sp. SGAir0037]|uniref:dTDP-4-dehydrorhamnose 3,5-epimerase n=1 Tax=Pontibacter sp. SGAir0037 TaxID=2571030 RepID=UPI0010CD3EA1|nr:dTDP-4-dehydrorhamnose 3,5-epimerase [Pontibacter sp. SGAir0037]QCR22828.1 dTDP-4-dehydrorhamnose 3,5-epimerase [Pontibacter sp. SGAir0037]
MIFTETKLKGAFIIDVKRLEDERGFFGRSWCQREFEEHGLTANVVQANVSYNKKKGTLRGMHYQLSPYEETKLVRCTRGAIYDVIIDLRPDSPTYKQWIGVELTADSYRMLFVPEQFGHGFITLEDNTDVTYQVTQFYTPGAERGIRYNDPAFNIEWPIEPQIISEKDKAHPDFVNEFVKSNNGQLLV